MMRQKSKRLLAALLAVLLALAAGCGDRKSPESSAPGEEASSSQPPEDAAQKDQQLYNAYIDVSNLMAGDIRESINCYFKYVIYQDEFQYIDADYFCYTVSESGIAAADSAYELATAKAGKDDLDKQYLKLYPFLKKVAVTLNEIEEYTDLKGYADDDYEKGKELHEALWTAYQQYQTQGDAFMERLDVVAQDRHAEEMARMQEAGAVVYYAVNTLLDTAMEMENQIYAQDIYDENVTELDLEALQPAYDAYVKALEDCAAALEDERQVRDEGFNTAYTDMLLQEAKDGKVALTDLWQRVKDQKPVDQFELTFAFAADGTIRKFEEQVDKMIDSYNSAIS